MNGKIVVFNLLLFCYIIFLLSIHQWLDDTSPPAPQKGACVTSGGCCHGKVQAVVYNRAPKCASRTVMYTMDAVRKKNHFSVYKMKPVSQSRMFPEESWEEVRYNFSHVYHTPFLYAQHTLFFDFVQNSSLPVTTYVNVVRDPVERVISRHYYLQYGSAGVWRAPNVTLSLDACLRKKGVVRCIPETESPVMFLCGHDPICRTISAASVELAKKNVERYYLVVGMVEDLPAFFRVLEYLLPSFFAEISEEYVIKGEKHRAKYRTAKKEEVSEESRQRIRTRLAPEYDLYHFVRSRFYVQHQAIMLKKGTI